MVAGNKDVPKKVVGYTAGLLPQTLRFMTR